MFLLVFKNLLLSLDIMTQSLKNNKKMYSICNTLLIWYNKVEQHEFRNFKIWKIFLLGLIDFLLRNETLTNRKPQNELSNII